jgi:hypothetical protein
MFHVMRGSSHIDKSIMILENCVNLVGVVPDLCSETCLTSSYDRTKITDIKMKISDIQENVDP